MSSDPVVELTNISKCYQIYDNPADRLKQFLSRGRRRYFREFWALRGVSFSVPRGECLGLVGRNGSGKSTLLQILAGTVQPTQGAYAVRGRLSALLELGAGFNPEFTGRENLVLNATLMGLTPKEIEARTPLIERFAEIGSFIDQPVKTYSSGMFVRLAFATAIHVEPEVLIVDEALSVGDAAFQYKCMRKIEELRARGMSILFVTHDLAAVKNLCTVAGWLHEGTLRAFGNVVTVCDQYNDFLFQAQAEASNSTQSPTSSPLSTHSIPDEPPVTTHARILSATLHAASGSQISEVSLFENVHVRLTYQVYVSPPEGLVLGAAIFRNDDLYVCGMNTLLDGVKPKTSVGIHTLTLTLPRLSLLGGGYYFKAGVFDSSAKVIWDFHHKLSPFYVQGKYLAEGVVVLPHEWTV